MAGLFDFLGSTTYGADATLPGMMDYAQPPQMLKPGVMPAMGNPLMPQPDLMTSPISPEVLAKNAAARGIPPPPVDFTPGDVGAALTGSNVPLPRSRPPVMAQGGGPGAPMDITSQAQKDSAGAEAQQGGGNKLMEALKGVKMPANPELQRVATPAAPRPTTAIKGGDLIALLQSLQAGKPAGGLDLPATLGQALRQR
jgi:hypothetical protein